MTRHHQDASRNLKKTDGAASQEKAKSSMKVTPGGTVHDMGRTSASLKRIQKPQRQAKKVLSKRSPKAGSSMKVSAHDSIQSVYRANGLPAGQLCLRTHTDSLGSMVDPGAATYREAVEGDMLDAEFEQMQVMQDPSVEITTQKKSPFLQRAYDEVKAENLQRVGKLFPAGQRGKNVKLKQADSRLSKMSGASAETVQTKPPDRPAAPATGNHKPVSHVQNINQFYNNEPESAKLTNASQSSPLSAKKPPLVEFPPAQYNPKMVLFSQYKHDDDYDA